ncbi:hypothetical protein [Demequina sp.]|uniref:hypothetical protein n=1 Tax=Demequina sp. TaxID=2050685 RepID=UPI003A85408B
MTDSTPSPQGGDHWQADTRVAGPAAIPEPPVMPEATPWTAPGAAPTPPAAAPAAAQPAPGPAAPAPAPGLVYGPTGTPVPPPPSMGHAAPTYRSWQPGIIPLRPLSFGDFLAAPFKAMRYNRAVILGGPLLFTIITAILSVTAGWMVFNDVQLFSSEALPAWDNINVQTIVMVVLAVISLLLTDVLCGSIVAPGVARAVMGERVGLAVAWRQMRARLGSLLILYVLATLAYTLLTLIVMVPLLWGLIAGDSSTGAILVTLLLVFVVLVPAGLFITLVQGLARAMVVLEDISAWAALGRLTRLVKGRFWWSMLIIFVTMLLINIVASVLQYVGQMGAVVAAFTAPDNGWVLAIAFFVVYGIAFVVSLVLTYAYMGSVHTLIYIDLRMRHEGFDLDLARAAEARATAQSGR